MLSIPVNGEYRNPDITPTQLLRYKIYVLICAEIFYALLLRKCDDVVIIRISLYAQGIWLVS